MDYAQKFDDDFRELFTKRLREDHDFGKELWSALANVSWYNQSDPNNTECGYCSFRYAGTIIATMLCHGDYGDWYFGDNPGVVSEQIANAMKARGWRYEV